MADLSCQQFGDLMIRYQHWDRDIIQDVTPVEGWVGHVATGPWPNEPDGGGGGVSRQFDRINRMFPNLSGCWKDVTAQGCIGKPCAPDAKLIGFGFTRDEYHEQTTSYETDLFCWDLIMSADRAKEQFAGLIVGLREATLWINNHRFRTEALRVAKRKVLSAAPEPIPATWTSATDSCETLTLNALPTSMLTIQILQRFVSILTGEGYVGANPLPNNLMFELVTDNITGNVLVEQNPALKDFLRVSTPEMFGQLYKYGVTATVGNFGIRFDLWPLRYQIVSGTTINLVLPYENVPATEGIKAEYNTAYDRARIQIDFIWHKMAMRSLVRRGEQINSMMPFAVRDFGGRWQFGMDNLTCKDPVTGALQPVDNMRRNQGKFWADWRMATKAEHPEWGVAFISLRDVSCITDNVPCNDAYPYVTQDYSSANTPCPNPDVDFVLCVPGDGQEYSLNSVTCNGVPLLEEVTTFADIAALVIGLNTDFSALGTWSNPEGTTLRLEGSTCAAPGVDVTCTDEIT
jgi:hypothetical protein